jgi:hypothetical protein
MLSLTSSTIDQAVRAAAPLLNPVEDQEIYESFKIVLKYANIEDLLQVVAPPGNDNHGEDNGGMAEGQPAPGEGATQEEPPIVENNNSSATQQEPPPGAENGNGSVSGAVNLPTDQLPSELNEPPQPPNNDPLFLLEVGALDFIDTVTKSTENPAEIEEIQLEMALMSLDQLKAIFAKLGLKNNASKNKLLSDLKGWVICDPKKQMYYKKTNPELKKLIQARRINGLGSNPGKAKLESALLAYDEKRRAASLARGINNPEYDPSVPAHFSHAYVDPTELMMTSL